MTRVADDTTRSIARPVRLVHVTTVALALGFLRGQVRYMKARGLDVRAVSSPGEGLAEFEASEGVAVHPISMLRRITPARDLVALGRLVRHFSTVRPHIVHAHTPKGGLLGTTAAWLAGVPVRVYHMRGLPYMTATGHRRVLLRWTEKVACALADRVLCVSPSLRDVAVREGICRPGKIAVLANGSGNGVDSGGRFNPGRWTASRGRIRREHGIPADAPVVGFVGRIVRDKGLVELMTAWQQVRACGSVHLLLVGQIEPQDPLPGEVLDLLRTDDRVHLCGTQPDAAPFYAAMDIVVLPTYREGFPNVPLEAAAMGLPVVATRIPGCVDAVEDGVTGTLVPPRDAPALSAAIRAYLDAPDLRYRHGRAGRERVVRTFAQETIWAELYSEYERLLQARRLPLPQPARLRETFSAE